MLQHHDHLVSVPSVRPYKRPKPKERLLQPADVEPSQVPQLPTPLKPGQSEKLVAVPMPHETVRYSLSYQVREPEQTLALPQLLLEQ